MPDTQSSQHTAANITNLIRQSRPIRWALWQWSDHRWQLQQWVAELAAAPGTPGWEAWPDEHGTATEAVTAALTHSKPGDRLLYWPLSGERKVLDLGPTQEPA
jgi:hypothetical protein